MKSLVKNILKTVGLGIYLEVFLLKKRNQQGEMKLSFDRMRNFYKDIVGEGGLVFDVGANLGNYTQVFLDLSCSVIAVEPQQYCMQFMKIRFGKNHPNISFINKGLDKKPGKTKLHIGDSHTLSSMSDKWMDAVKDSGRFGNQKWDKTVEVDVTTLDDLIKEYGMPKYCKIDVEGFEYNVLSGLSSSIAYISFEFTYECFDAAIQCIKHICTLGDYKFNFVKGDYEGYELEEWLSETDYLKFLKNFTGPGSMGDIVAKIK